MPPLGAFSGAEDRRSLDLTERSLPIRAESVGRMDHGGALASAPPEPAIGVARSRIALCPALHDKAALRGLSDDPDGLLGG